MKKKNTPSELRAQAKKLLQKAEEAEKKIYVQIGKTVEKHHKEDYKNFKVEAFKKQVEELLGAK